MENKTFYNGVNFTRALLAGACNLDEVGTLGQLMVLENLIGPMIGQLYEMSDMIPINGEMVNVNGVISLWLFRQNHWKRPLCR